jgi:hypothetical protein
MSDTVMSVLLICISGILLFAILGWGILRSIIGKQKNAHPHIRLKGIHNFYKLVLLLFIATGCLFLLIPSSRKYIGPIHWLDNDLVNGTGFIILAIAFFLIIRAQRRLDRHIHLYYQGISEQGNSKIVPDTENHLLGYILLVYAGMFIVVSTIATGILLLIALIGWYARFSSRKYKTLTQLQE